MVVNAQFNRPSLHYRFHNASKIDLNFNYGWRLSLVQTLGRGLTADPAELLEVSPNPLSWNRSGNTAVTVDQSSRNHL